MHLISILPLKFKRADYCPFDQFDQITLHFLLQFHTRHFQRWAIPEKIQTRVEYMEFPLHGYWRKGTWKSQGPIKKEVEFMRIL